MAIQIELRKKFEELFWDEFSHEGHCAPMSEFITKLIQAVNDYFKQSGKMGGEITKKRGKAYYQEIGRKGGLKAKRKHVE